MSLPLVILIALFSAVLGAYAATGTTDSPAAPDATTSYSLEDIYNRLTTGATGTQRVFTEPSVAPGVGTMHTLNDIMGVAPQVDDTDGASSGEVLTGRTF